MLPNFPGWTIQAAADMDGDRRADVVWHNRDTGELFWYLMDGVTVLGGQGFSMPPGYELRVAGDFNLDGYADMAWSNGQKIVVTMNDGAGRLVGPVDVTGIVEGWGLVASGVYFGR